MINWRIVRGTMNPVEVLDMNTKTVVLRVYDFSGRGNDWDHAHNQRLRRQRFLNNLKKAGMIILAVKMLEIN